MTSGGHLKGSSVKGREEVSKSHFMYAFLVICPKAHIGVKYYIKRHLNVFIKYVGNGKKNVNDFVFEHFVSFHMS